MFFRLAKPPQDCCFVSLWTSHFLGITKSICEKIYEIKEEIVKVASWSINRMNLQAHTQEDAVNLPFVLQFRRAVIFFILADAKGSEKGVFTEHSPSFLAAEMYLPGFSSKRRDNPVLIFSDRNPLIWRLSQHWDIRQSTTRYYSTLASPTAELRPSNTDFHIHQL